MNPPLENNPVRHTLRIKAQIRQIIDHLNEEVGLVREPKALVLFENSLNVLGGLVKAYDDYETKGEKALRTELMACFPKSRITNIGYDKSRGTRQPDLEIR